MIELTCARCNKPYEVSSHRAHLSRYCSFQCTKHRKFCQQCNKLITRRPGRRRFCCRACASNFMVGPNAPETKPVYVSVHRTVLLLFKGRPPTKKHWAAHWDNNKTNNKLNNLRWATPKENKEDQRRHKTLPMGDKHYKTRLTTDKVKSMRKKRKQGVIWRELAAEYKVCIWTVRRICNREAWRHV